ncbi:chromobox protein homolog 3-like [Contarinia nasturtii]|uniref:chromobox protein homolog 3-like n=1 Tax=Contarinia nasturtii TaxID=265458 RepID=UPI0012D40E96|nr:chromobox protein homolog 3-like [Contarinia nasturtii]
MTSTEPTKLIDVSNDTSASGETSKANKSRAIKKGTQCRNTTRPARHSTQQKKDITKSRIREEGNVTEATSMLGNNSKSRSYKPDDETGTILGATEVNGQLKFIFKWKDQVEPTIVSNEVAKHRYTNAVLDFYESCLRWDDSENDEHKCVLKK